MNMYSPDDNFLTAECQTTILSIIPAPPDLLLYRRENSGRTWTDRPICLGLVRRRWKMQSGAVHVDEVVCPIEARTGDPAETLSDVTGWGIGDPSVAPRAGAG